MLGLTRVHTSGGRRVRPPPGGRARQSRRALPAGVGRRRAPVSRLLAWLCFQPWPLSSFLWIGVHSKGAAADGALLADRGGSQRWGPATAGGRTALFISETRISLCWERRCFPRVRGEHLLWAALVGSSGTIWRDGIVVTYSLNETQEGGRRKMQERLFPVKRRRFQ